MKLVKLHINQDWVNKECYVGEIEFDDQNGCIKLTLSDVLARRLFDIVGEELVKQTQECTKRNLTSIRNPHSTMRCLSNAHRIIPPGANGMDAASR